MHSRDEFINTESQSDSLERPRQETAAWKGSTPAICLLIQMWEEAEICFLSCS